MTDRELMQHALDAMLNNPDDISDEMFESIKALKERLAQVNEFEPDWDAMAVMVEEQQRMAKRIEELEAQQKPWVKSYAGGKPNYTVPQEQPVKCYVKTWQQRCEEHPDHNGIVTERMIQARMQEEIDELRAALEPRQWQGLSFFDKTLLRTTHAPLKPVYHDRVHDRSVCAEVVTDWDTFFTEIENKLREKNT